MRIWRKLKPDGNSYESSWGIRDHMPTLTCVWNKPTQFIIFFAFQSWFHNLMWSLATHDDSTEFPSNFNLQISLVSLSIYWAPYLRGCLSYFHPVNFASKIILPETLSTERLYLGKNWIRFGLNRNNFLTALGAIIISQSVGTVATSRKLKNRHILKL